jgi:hypothetical protein
MGVYFFSQNSSKNEWSDKIQKSMKSVKLLGAKIKEFLYFKLLAMLTCGFFLIHWVILVRIRVSLSLIKDIQSKK